MDKYKNLFKSRTFRMKILALFKFIPDKTMLKLEYRIKFNRKLNLKNPKRFTEKIQKYKLEYKNQLMIQCSDKFTAREYVRSKGLENILIEHYGVFDRVDEIDFTKLPEKFVLKLSNASGTNYICRDKKQLDICKLKKLFGDYSLQAKVNAGREWPYSKSKSVIVAEKLLEDSSHQNNAINDYKIFCYNGTPKYIYTVSDRYTENCNHLVFNTEWEKQNIVLEGGRIDEDEPRPENLEEMLKIASTLSEDFPFARIDLYSIHNKIYFGEITFYPWSGFMEFEPDDFDYILGEDLSI